MAKRQKTSNSRPGRLRIVAGNWRSRLLDIADVAGLRPTSARIRETLFNWLEPQIHGACCLDLFAGTGALGLEALSRGAARAVFVENSMPAVAVLNANIKILGAAGAVVRHMNALDYLRGENTEQFDLVFLDPPFASDVIEDVCRRLDERKMLTDRASVYIEQARSKAEPTLPESWEMLKNKTAGNVRYMLVRQKT